MPNLMNKLFIINKERGPTSFDVVDAFRKASRIRKVGHTGTLDETEIQDMRHWADQATSPTWVMELQN